MKLDHYFTQLTKVNSKWIKGLDVRPEVIKHLEENIRLKNLLTFALALIFAYDTKSINTKENNELDFIKIKQFCLQGHHQQSEEKTHRIGRNMYQSYI